jgi:hypothetical protein
MQEFRYGDGGGFLHVQRSRHEHIGKADSDLE